MADGATKYKTDISYFMMLFLNSYAIYKYKFVIQN